MERNIPQQPIITLDAPQYRADTEEIIMWIIDPLRHTNHIDDFHGCIADSATRLREGSLGSVREVEIWLTSSVEVLQNFLLLCQDLANDC